MINYIFLLSVLIKIFIAYIFLSISFSYLVFNKELNKQNKKSIFISLVILIILFSLEIRSHIRPIPVEIYDNYFNLALSYFHNNTFSSGERGLYFQLIVLFLVKTFKSFSSIVYFNNIFAIIASLLTLYILFKTIYIKNEKSKSYKILSYIFIFISFYLITTSSQRIYYEYCLRPESISQFFEIILLLIFYKIITSKNNKVYLFIFILFSIFLSFFQSKFVFLSILNIILVIFLLFNSKDILSIKIKNLFIIITFPLFIFLIFNNFLEKKFNYSESNTYQKNFQYTIHFWRNQRIINKYMLIDYNDTNFNKFDKELLKKYIDFNKKIFFLYPDNKNISVYNFDKIMYEHALGLDDNSQEIFYKFKRYYYIKSLVNSPQEYIKSYFYEMKRFVENKEIRIFKRIQYYLPQDTYYAHEYLQKITKDMNSPEFDQYLIDTNFKEESKFVLTDNKLVFYLYSAMNYLFLPIIILFFIIININKYIYKLSLNNTLKNMAVYCILAFFLMDSVVAFTFMFLDRYINEIYPLHLLSFYFSLSFIVHFFITLQSNEKK